MKNLFIIMWSLFIFDICTSHRANQSKYDIKSKKIQFKHTKYLQTKRKLQGAPYFQCTRTDGLTNCSNGITCTTGSGCKDSNGIHCDHEGPWNVCPFADDLKAGCKQNGSNIDCELFDRSTTCYTGMTCMPGSTCNGKTVNISDAECNTDGACDPSCQHLNKEILALEIGLPMVVISFLLGCICHAKCAKKLIPDEKKRLLPPSQGKVAPYQKPENNKETSIPGTELVSLQQI